LSKGDIFLEVLILLVLLMDVDYNLCMIITLRLLILTNITSLWRTIDKKEKRVRWAEALKQKADPTEGWRGGLSCKILSWRTRPQAITPTTPSLTVGGTSSCSADLSGSFA
jgi:hypothetical protein